MANVVFSKEVGSSEPSERPVTILGKKANLSQLCFNDVSRFLGDKVTSEVCVCVELQKLVVSAAVVCVFYRPGQLLLVL